VPKFTRRSSVCCSASICSIFAANARDLLFDFKNVFHLACARAENILKALLGFAGVLQAREKISVLLGDFFAVLRFRLDTAEGFEFSNCGGELRRRNPQGRLKRPSGSLRSGNVQPCGISRCAAREWRRANHAPRRNLSHDRQRDVGARSSVQSPALLLLAGGLQEERAQAKALPPVVHPGALWRQRGHRRLRLHDLLCTASHRAVRRLGASQPYKAGHATAGGGDRVDATKRLDEQLEAVPSPGLALPAGRPQAREAQATAPMIARNISLSIVAKDFDVARGSLDAILARHSGYAAGLNVATPQGAARTLQASLRIPAPQLAAQLLNSKPSAVSRRKRKTAKSHPAAH